MVTHGNLCANARAIMFDGPAGRSRGRQRRVAGCRSTTTWGSSASSSRRCYAPMPVDVPADDGFVKRPSLWLDAIHRIRGTITFAPNFAYALVDQARRATPSSRAGICRACASSAAAPSRSRPTTLRAFLETLRAATARARVHPALVRHGRGDARDHASSTCADAAAAPTRSTPTRCDAERRAVAGRDGGGALELVSCGRPFPGHELAHRRRRRAQRLGEREVGEIWLRGPRVTAGYFRNAEAHRARRSAARGVAGSHRRPRLPRRRQRSTSAAAPRTSSSSTAELLPAGHRVGRRAKVDGVRDGQRRRLLAPRRDGAEQRRRRRRDAQSDAAARSIAAAIIAPSAPSSALTVAEVHLIKRGTLPKTSSGKVRAPRDASAGLEDARARAA